MRNRPSPIPSLRPRAGVLLLAGTVACGAMLGAGCASTPPPPRGTSGGRVPIEATTRAEHYDPRILPADYMAFADEAAQGLIIDLPEIPEFTEAPGRPTIIFGDIQNETGIISSSEFELVREKIKNNLLRSRTFNNNFRFLIGRSQLDELRRREVNSPTNPARFDEANTYFLNGTMYRVERGRGDVNMYLVTFQLVNFDTGQVLWLRDYQSKR
ncbi:MAG: hypothetical protein KDA31_10180 [Phycisphaerales bacterium]|nr:hypothetical protein [Phycisphaerales bacterium]MCB9841485.1 hypothetical protein [Phycisphaeraceae bacterium]